jgi:hypothetical protein
MVKYRVLFEVRAEFLTTIYTSFGFKGLESAIGPYLVLDDSSPHTNLYLVKV